jgi:hypothetical protein
MNERWSPFDPPDQERLGRYADDLLHRAELVRRHGWDDYRHLWSHGEVLGTALMLRDYAELQRSGETTDCALQRWAFQLWGLSDGQSDTEAGLSRTRAWFDALGAALHTPQRQGR